MSKANESSDTISFLSVGTQILSKDLMDQYIRTLGKYRTHYAQSAESARRILEEGPIDILLTEFWLPDSNAYDLLQELKAHQKSAAFTVLAVDENSQELVAIAQELEVDSMLIKPFTAKDVKTQIDQYLARREDKTSLDQILRTAESSLQGKEYGVAEKCFQAAVKTHPKSARAQYRLGAHYFWKPDYESAEKHLKLALELDPTYVPAISTLGMLSLRKKDYPLADALLNQAQELSPLNPRRPSMHAQLLIDWGAAGLKSALTKFPDNTDIRFDLGRFLVYQHDYVGALQALEKVRFSKTDPRQQELDILCQVAKKLGGLRT